MNEGWKKKEPERQCSNRCLTVDELRAEQLRFGRQMVEFEKREQEKLRSKRETMRRARAFYEQLR